MYMRLVKKSVLAVAAISLLLGWFGRPTAVLACSCVAGMPAEYFANATDVFVGTVKTVTDKNSKKLIDFNITESRKGSNAADLLVSTGLGDGDCGVDFKEGNGYLVYTYDDAGVLSTGLCSGTALVNGEAPAVVDEPVVEPEDGSNLLVTTVVLGAAYGVGMLTMYLWGRRKKNL